MVPLIANPDLDVAIILAAMIVSGGLWYVNKSLKATAALFYMSIPNQPSALPPVVVASSLTPMSRITYPRSLKRFDESDS